MIRPTRPVSLALACLVALHSTPRAAEYVGPATTPAPESSTVPSGSNGPVPTPTDTLRDVPRNAYESRPAVGIPMRSIFRDTRAPYYDNLRSMDLTPTARLNESVSLNTDIDLPDFRGSFPMLHRGFAPDEADLKIGPVYFKLRHISAAVLYSDNVNRTEDNKESDVLGIVSIGGQIMAQLTEGFQIAVAGNFVYLPFEGESGFSGFALRAPYSFGVASAPIARSQIVWEPVVFGLPLTIADEFTIGMAQFRNGAYDGFALFEGGDFEAYDRSGYRVLRSRTFPTGDEFNRSAVDEDTEFVYYSNEISLSTGGPLPGQNIFRFRASHENLWYQDEADELRLPSVRDRVTLTIQSVRENLRFKPYVRYEYFHRDNPEISDHEAWVGVRGPITDLLFFRGEVGALWRTEQGAQDLLWRLGLYHTPSPYMWHALEYARATSDFHDELDQRVTYRLTKTLGPELNLSAYTSYHWIEDFLDTAYDRTEWRNGVRLTYIASPKTTFRLSAQHTNIAYDDPAEETQSWRGRIECTHRFYERFLARAIYQYEQRESDRSGRDYAENLAYLSLSWLFD